MRYAKLHGCENAYVYMTEAQTSGRDLPELARAISDRRSGGGGVGSDGLIVYAPSTEADVRMIVYNADGSRAAMCGNGIRGLAKWVLDRDAAAGEVLALSPSVAALRARIHDACPPLVEVLDRLERLRADEYSVRRLTVQTDSGKKIVYALMLDGLMQVATVDMGFASHRLDHLGPARPREVHGHRSIAVDGAHYDLNMVSVGNLHAVVMVPSVADVALERVGPAIETAEMFPDRTNVHFVEYVDRRTLLMRSWERGSGATPACGTGACAAAYVADADCVDADAGNVIEVRQPGGTVFVHLERDNDAIDRSRVHLIGPAEWVETGDWQPPA